MALCLEAKFAFRKPLASFCCPEARVVSYSEVRGQVADSCSFRPVCSEGMTAVQRRDVQQGFMLLQNIISYIPLMTDSFKVVVLNLVQLAKHLEEGVF